MSRDYYLPACLVLWAAVIGNRKACQFAYDNLPLARRWSAENQPHIYETARKNTRARHRNHSGQFVSTRQAAEAETKPTPFPA